jgi:hypothetical protein
MRKGLAYLDLAEKCQKLARQIKDARQRKQLEAMARSWEIVAADRAKQLAKAKASKPRRKAR